MNHYWESVWHSTLVFLFLFALLVGALYYVSEGQNQGAALKRTWIEKLDTEHGRYLRDRGDEQIYAFPKP